jgi:hypothetical protein
MAIRTPLDMAIQREPLPILNVKADVVGQRTVDQF